jgi:hypothetical protein
MAIAVVVCVGSVSGGRWLKKVSVVVFALFVSFASVRVILFRVYVVVVHLVLCVCRLSALSSHSMCVVTLFAVFVVWWIVAKVCCAPIVGMMRMMCVLWYVLRSFRCEFGCVVY